MYAIFNFFVIDKKGKHINSMRSERPLESFNLSRKLSIRSDELIGGLYDEIEQSTLIRTSSNRVVSSAHN